MENKQKETKFEKAYKLNTNDKTEKKNGLTYLSWAWAWAEFKKIYLEATYEIKKIGDKQLPYVYDEATGYMVFTEVIADGVKHEMWLPVMDGANKAMKDKEYEYTTKYGTKKVEPATMFDINKTIMRCLTKNLAMFGLGLYIYAGEDLPESEIIPSQKEIPANLPKPTALMTLKAKIQELGAKTDEEAVKILGDKTGVTITSFKVMTEKQAQDILETFEGDLIK